MTCLPYCKLSYFLSFSFPSDIFFTIQNPSQFTFFLTFTFENKIYEYLKQQIFSFLGVSRLPPVVFCCEFDYYWSDRYNADGEIKRWGFFFWGFPRKVIVFEMFLFASKGESVLSG